ncbi:MAG: transglycosylase SLT domain-containing protein [Runella sp.]
MKKWQHIASNMVLIGAMITSMAVYAQKNQVDSLISTEELPQTEVLADSTVPEALIRERLAKLQNQIPLRYHKVTHQFVEYFIYRKPSFVKRMLENMHLYFPLYEQTLQKYGMPSELKFLSLIESGLNPRIISYAGAGGLWQFMPATGREYGMKQDDYIDERFDPVKSTDAACRYLKRLYHAFGDWEMALAAYNVGPGNVKRAMRRSGSSSFWGIYNFLPKQTRHYVPQFVAMMYMMHYHADHGIFADAPEYPMLADTVQITGYFNLHTFTKLSGITLEEIYKLNPQVINTELPSYLKNYVLHIPSHRYDFVAANRQMIWDSASKSPAQIAAMLALQNTSDSTTQIQTTGGLVAAEGQLDDPETIVSRKPKRLVHVIRRGETLASIANHYGVNLYDLKHWNRLNTNRVVRGKQLIIYKETTQKSDTRLTKFAPTKAKVRYHQVQRGDTLIEIANRYGIAVSQLKKLNRLKSNTVRKGQKLIVG